MAKKNKPIHLNNLSSFWNKAEAWISTNFQSLFENDESQEEAINGISERLDALSPCDNAKIHELFPSAPDMVDLGLPSGLLWAKWNIGAKQETDYGLYFKWGDAKGHTSEELDYFLDGTYPLEFTDAATIAYGIGYRVPTINELLELKNNTVNAVEIINDVKGMKFTSRTDGSRYIFIPFAGNMDFEGHNEGRMSLWSSSIEDISRPYAQDMYSNEYTNFSIETNWSNRGNGLSIRAVKQP